MAFLAVPIFILQLFLALILVLSAIASKQCKVDNGSKLGFVLMGHVFQSFTVERLAFCYSACNTDPACQSLNFNLANRTCDCNSESSKSKPGSYHQNDIYVYADNPDRGKKGSSPSVPGLSCKNIQDCGDLDTSGTYWIRPEGSRVSFQGYCDISAIGKWTRITQSWIQQTLKGGVTLTYGNENNGLTISGQVTKYACGSGVPPGALTLIKGYWTKIKYTQEFRGISSCYSIFGDNGYGRDSVNNQSPGLHPFDASEGDSITNQYYMGGNSHVFDGKVRKCNNLATNFWDNPNPSVRRATVVLRRQLTAEKAGIFTGTTCGKPTYLIKDIYVYF